MFKYAVDQMKRKRTLYLFLSKVPDRENKSKQETKCTLYRKILKKSRKFYLFFKEILNRKVR